RRDRLVDARRTDRTVVDRTQPVRTRFHISKLGAANPELRTVTVLPRRIGDHTDFLRRLQFAHPPQRLGQNGALQLKLCFITSVLIVTTSAAAEVGTRRSDSHRGWFAYFGQFRAQ